MLNFNPQFKFGFPEELWYNLDSLPDEQWKDIIGYENLYCISNYGRVKSLEKSF